MACQRLHALSRDARSQFLHGSHAPAAASPPTRRIERSDDAACELLTIVAISAHVVSAATRAQRPSAAVSVASTRVWRTPTAKRTTSCARAVCLSCETAL